MKLYYHPASTVSRMVMLFAAEEGIALDYEVVDLMSGAHHRPQYKAINPNALVPGKRGQVHFSPKPSVHLGKEARGSGGRCPAPVAASELKGTEVAND